MPSTNNLDRACESSQSRIRTSDHRPIADFAVVGNCHTAALIDTRATVAWFCLPRFDSPAICADILDPRHGGGIYIDLEEPVIRRSRRYIDATPILRTELTTRSGTLRITDFMPAHDDTSSPGAPPAASMLCRLFECTDGVVNARLRCELRPGFATAQPHAKVDDTGWTIASGPHAAHVSASIDLRRVAGDLKGEFALKEGQTRWLTISHCDSPSLRDPHDLFKPTADWWRRWSEQLRYTGAYTTQAFAPRSRSSSCATRPPARSSPHPQPRFPNSWARASTGTTATAGSVMRRCACARSCVPGSATRHGRF